MTHYETHYWGTGKDGREGRQVYHSTTLTPRHEELRAAHDDAYTIRYMDTNKDRTSIQATVIHPARVSNGHGKPDAVFVVGRRAVL